jgi:hypothetical protein
MADKKSDRRVSAEEVADKASQAPRYADMTEEERDAILEDVPESALPVTNTELSNADTFTGSEKTTTAERNRNMRAASGQNVTIMGMPSDVHQAVVAVAQRFKDHAQVHEELVALLAKYEGTDEVNSEVHAVLKEAEKFLARGAKVYTDAHVALEKNA